MTMEASSATERAGYDVAKGVRSYWISGIAGIIILGVTLFWPAGTLAWPMGWALVAITTFWVVGTAVVSPPDLLAERAERRKGTNKLDTFILGIAGLGSVARPIVAGLDWRYGWTDVPLWLRIVGLAAASLGYVLVVWATKENAYFSKVVRIQADREHTVATGGPYKLVRHPGYVGQNLFELGGALLLNSWWALIPAGFAALMFIVRTANEDKTLQAELPGYKEFAQQTKYRLLPGIW